MTGYLKETIDFDSIQKDLDSAKALKEADRTMQAKEVLKDMAKKLQKEGEK